MINNRQNGRRRGRGGAPRQNGGNGQSGNRIDNRARGNAAQLHEKYKTLARDAQTQGDRVMAEYYLQFADHYFRVLSENRPRFEEQQQRRDRFDNQEFEDENDGEGEGSAAVQNGVQANGRGDEHPRESREERQPRELRRPRPARTERGDTVEEVVAEPAPAPAEAAETVERAPAPEAPAPEAPRRGRGRPRRTAEPAADGAERIEADRLPPSLSLNGGEDAEAPAAEEKPKRRTRRPRAEATSAEA